MWLPSASLVMVKGPIAVGASRRWHGVVDEAISEHGTAEGRPGSVQSLSHIWLG